MYSTYPSVAAFFVLHFTSVIVNPSHWRWFFFPCLFAIYIHTIFYTSTGDRVSDYFISLPLSIALCNASTLILLSDPQRTAFRKGQTAPIDRLDLSSRLVWAADLITNWRGINWIFEIPGLRRSDAPKMQYVVSQLAWASAHYLMYDAATFVNRRNPAFLMEGEKMGDRGYLHQAFNVLMFWFTFANSMALRQTLSSAVAVGSGWYNPRDWPPMFGPWLQTTTVRKFWGQTWHQMLRRPISTHGKYMAQQILRLTPGSVLSSYTQLYIAFLLSGLFHCAAEWMMSHNLKRTISALWFFIVQGIAITAEDIVIYLGKRFGLLPASALSPTIGILWVLAWTVWSGPLWMEPMIRGGIMEDGPPISVFEILLGSK